MVWACDTAILSLAMHAAMTRGRRPYGTLWASLMAVAVASCIGLPMLVPAVPAWAPSLVVGCLAALWQPIGLLPARSRVRTSFPAVCLVAAALTSAGLVTLYTASSMSDHGWSACIQRDARGGLTCKIVSVEG